MKEPTQITKVELITPQMAGEWLKQLEEAQEKLLFRQRPPKEGFIQSYAQDMKAGKWYLHHQGIAFDQNGYLLDGQNRLWAVIRANTPVYMSVTRGVIRTQDEDPMDTIDTGKSRTLSDILNVSHEVKGATEIASYARNIIQLVISAAGSPGLPQSLINKGIRASTAEALFVLNDLGFLPSFERIQVQLPQRKLRRAPLTAVLGWYHTAKPKKAEEFAKSYATLEELPKGSPVLLLYRYLTQGTTPAGKNLRARDVIPLVALAVQKFDAGDTLTTLQADRTPLRWIVKLNGGAADRILKRCTQ